MPQQPAPPPPAPPLPSGSGSAPARAPATSYTEAIRLLDTYGFPTYARLYAAAESAAQSRRRLDVVEAFAKGSLADVIKVAIGSAIGVGSVASAHVHEVAAAGLQARAPLGAGFGAANFGVGIGVGVVEGEIRATAPPVATYDNIKELARQFRTTALRQLPCLQQEFIRGAHVSAHAVLTQSQIEKTSAPKIAKEAAHQIDMLGRAWAQIAEVATEANKDTRGRKPKWRKCRIAAEVVGALAWFKRKHAKANFFHERLVDDYCEVGGLFTAIESYWRENGEKIVLRALMSSVNLGIGYGSRNSADREVYNAQRRNIETVAKTRITTGSTSGHLSGGTSNYR